MDNVLPYCPWIRRIGRSVRDRNEPQHQLTHSPISGYDARLGLAEISRASQRTGEHTTTRRKQSRIQKNAGVTISNQGLAGLLVFLRDPRNETHKGQATDRLGHLKHSEIVLE